MEPLFNSVVRVEELKLVVTDGVSSMTWVQATDPDQQMNWMLSYLKCRLDMTFLRPGKDVTPAQEAGRATDRIGVLFTYPYAPIKAGQRIVAIPNARGKIPVPGTFGIEMIPDKAQDYSDAHHIEVQIHETNQSLVGEWPGDGDEAPL